MNGGGEFAISRVISGAIGEFGLEVEVDAAVLTSSKLV
jgi:hypothetical protein